MGMSMAASEQERQAEGVIDVFGEAFMKLIHNRLRLEVTTFHKEKGVVQIHIMLMDIGSTPGAYMIDSHAISLTSDLNITKDY